MRTSMMILILALVATGLSISWSLTNAFQPKSEKSTAEIKEGESVRVRYARTHLELAKLDLRRVTELNKKMPNVLPAKIIAEFQRHVEIDEAQLNQYLQGEKADFHKICVRGAEAAVEVAEADLKRERALHERLRSDASALDLERASLVAKLAKLNLERILASEASTSAITHLQWQIEELRNEVLDLKRDQALELRERR